MLVFRHCSLSHLVVEGGLGTLRHPDRHVLVEVPKLGPGGGAQEDRKKEDGEEGMLKTHPLPDFVRERGETTVFSTTSACAHKLSLVIYGRE